MIHFFISCIFLQTICLEEEFSYLFEQEIDFNAPANFSLCLTPNERGVIQAKKDLYIEQPGLLISVGTERSLFDLILCAQSSGNNCLGLVVRDIHPKVKAYLDFVVLLLKLAEDKTDFLNLVSISSSSDPFSLLSDLDHDRQCHLMKIEEIRNRLFHSSLSSLMKKYYGQNLELFFFTYTQTSRFWQLPGSDDFIEYQKDEEAFQILKRYAMKGNILITTGDIGSLSFLKGFPIAVIDISNIPDFFFVDLCFELPTLKPRIIWTAMTREALRRNAWADYRCFTYESLTLQEREEMNAIFEKMKKQYVHPWKKFNDLMIRSFVKKKLEIIGLDCYCVPSYSKGFLEVLRIYDQ